VASRRSHVGRCDSERASLPSISRTRQTDIRTRSISTSQVPRIFICKSKFLPTAYIRDTLARQQITSAAFAQVAGAVSGQTTPFRLWHDDASGKFVCHHSPRRALIRYRSRSLVLRIRSRIFFGSRVQQARVFYRCW